MKKCMWGLLVGLTLGGVCRGSAQVVLDTSAPPSVPYCRTFTVTNTFLNNGDTFGGLVVTQEFPQASFQYIAGSTTARVNGAVALTGAAADPATNTTSALVWAWTNLSASVVIDHLLITEVYYNTPLTPMADNQWIELFNPTTNTVSMAGWSIRDALPGQTDALPAFDFAPGEFVVIAGRTNAFLAANPAYSGRVFEVADGTLGSSLNDFADGIFLINAASQTVDAVSYAASTAAFNPAVPAVAVGHSIARDPANEDTDTRSDWIDCATPTPGTGRLPVGVPHGGAVSVVSSYRTICGAISGQFLTTAVYQQPPGASPATVTDAAFVTLLPGTLNVRKTPAVQSAGPGDSVAWDLTISNDGLGDVVNGVVVDQLGGGLQFQSFSVAPTNAAPIGQTVVWDASVLPALARLAPGSQVVVHVTAEVVACDDLWNRADATWGCQAGEICGDTAARGASALAGINFVRRPPALTGGVSPGSPISVDYCAGTPLTIALTNSPGAGPAVGIRLQAVLPTAYEIVGDAVSNGWIQIGTLNGGQVTNVTVTLRPAGTPCALLPARQVALLLPAYTDFCGTPFAPPALPFQFQLSPKPSAAVAKIEPSAITADAAPSTVTVQLTYANFHNTAVEIDDFFPQNAAIFATNVTQGGVLAATNIVWQIPAGTLEGSGVWTATYALGVSTTNPCVVPSGSFLDPVTAQLTDCHACASTATGSSDAYHIRCAPAAACGGSGGTGSCHYVSAKYGPSLTEVCHAAPLYSVFTDFGGLSAPTNWNGLVFTSDLAGGQGLLSSTGSVSVVVDGHDVTAGAAIVVTNGTLRIQLDGLSASGCPAPNAIAQNLTIGWEVSVTNAGRVTDYSSLSLPACGSSSDYWTWNAGESALAVNLSPITNPYGCLPVDMSIDISRLRSPVVTFGTNGFFPSYDVQVVLDLDADGNGDATYTYLAGTSQFTNLFDLGGAGITNREPVQDGHLLVWNLGDLGTNGDGTLHFRLLPGCSFEADDMLAAYALYNNGCESGTLPPVRRADSFPINVLPLIPVHLSTFIEPGLQPLVGTNITFTITVQNSGAAPAMNVGASLIFPTNMVLISATPAASGGTTTNATWDFHAAGGAGGGLRDLDGDGLTDDLPAGASMTITATLWVATCENHSVSAYSWYGCGGETCAASATAQAAFEIAAGSIVLTATQPANASICGTNTTLFRVRNTGLSRVYQVTANLTVPESATVIPGTFRYVSAGVTNAAGNPTGTGSLTDPLVFTAAQVPPLASVAPNDEVDIEVDLAFPCSVANGRQTYRTTASFVDNCGQTGSVLLAESRVTFLTPDLTLGLAASTDGVSFTTASLLGVPGHQIVYRLTVDHAITSGASVPAMAIQDILPSNVRFVGASVPPDVLTGTNGAIMAWSNATLMALAGGSPYAPAAAPVVLLVTGEVVTCAAPATDTATLGFGCSADQLCLTRAASHTLTTRPSFASLTARATLQLAACGGTMTLICTNLNGTAENIVLTDTAPDGYVFTGASVSGEFTGTNLLVTLGGSPVGSTVVLDLSTPASGATDAHDDAEDGPGFLDLGQNRGFQVVYTLLPTGDRLDHLANPNDLDFADPEPPKPSARTAGIALAYTDICGNPFTAAGSATGIPTLPDPDIDIQPNSAIVTNGQWFTFTATVRNRAEDGNAENLHVRLRLGGGWSGLSLITSNLVESGHGAMLYDQVGDTNALIDLPGVILNPVNDVLVFTFQAQARDSGGNLNILGEVVGDCQETALAGGAYTNTLGETALADTLSGTRIGPVHGEYYAFDQDESFVAGFRLDKTVRYPAESVGGQIRDARVGESLIYRIEADFFGNSFGSVLLTESLPAGLIYGQPVDAGSSGGITNWTYDASTGIFHVLPDPLVNGPSVFSVDLPVVVSNAVINQGTADNQTLIVNAVTPSFSVFGVQQPPVSTSALVRVVEPDLALTKTAAPIAGLQAGDVVTFTNVIVNTTNGLTNAYHVVFTDTLPPGLTFAGVDLGADGLDNDGDGVADGTDAADERTLVSGNTITVTETNNPALASLAPTQTVTIVFRAIVSGQWAGAPITNTSHVVYASMPDAPANASARDGRDGPGGALNDYARLSSVTLQTLPLQGVSKAFFASSQTNTADAATNLLTIGERVVYAIRVDVPQGVVSNLVITDWMPAGLDWVGPNPASGLAFPGAGYHFEVPTNGPVFAQTMADGLVIADGDPTPADSTTADGSGQNVVFTLPVVNTPADGNPTNNYFILKLECVVLDQPLNTGLLPGPRSATNVVTASDAFAAYAATSAVYTVVEPQIQLTKSLAPARVDAGDWVTVTVAVASSPLSLANAYHASVTDTLAAASFAPATVEAVNLVAGWSLTTNSLAGGVQVVVAAGQDVPVAPGQTATSSFRVRLAQGVTPNLHVVNTAAMAADTLYNAAPGGIVARAYAASSQDSLTVPNIALAKTLWSTSETGSVDSAGNAVQIGETANYALVITLPQGTVSNLVVAENVPAGMAYVFSNAWVDASSFNGSIAPLVESPTGAANALAASGQAMTFTFQGNTVATGTSGTSGNTFTLHVPVVVLNNAGNKGLAGQQTTHTNTATLNFAGNPSNAVSSGAVITTNIEPHVTLTKTITPATADAGDTLTVTLVVTNSGLATAYDVQVSDVLNPSFADLATAAGYQPVNGWAFTNAAGTVQFATDPAAGYPTNTLPANTAVTLQFRVTAAQAIRPNTTWTNVAVVTAADTIFGTNPISSSDQQRNEAGAAATNDVSVGNLALTKTLWSTSETNAADSTGNNVQIGETITYRLALTMPQGTVTNLALTDAIPAGLAYVYGSATVDSNGFNGTPGALAESPTGAAGGLAGNGQGVTFTLQGATVCNGTAGTSSNTFAVMFKTIVLNVGGNLGLAGHQTAFTNQASVTFPGNASNAVSSGTVTATAIEPQLAISQILSPTNNVDAGDWLTISLTVTNAGLAADYDMAITDVLNPIWFDVTSVVSSNIPAGFIFTNNSGTVSIVSNPQALQTNRTLAAGRAMTVIFRAKAAQTLTPNTILTNAASVVADTISGTNLDSTSDQQRILNAATLVSATALSRNVAAYKTLVGTEINRPGNNLANQATIGELVTYSLTITVPEGTTPGVVFQDLLDPGLAYVSNVTMVATSNVSVANNPPTVTVLDSGVGRNVQFTLGDIVNANSGNSGTDQVVITYQAVVLDQNTLPSSPGNQAGVTLSNSATFKWGTNAFVSSGSAAPVTIVEPTLNVAALVAPDNSGAPGTFAAALTAQDASNRVYYRIVITNAAAATDTMAFDLSLIDTLTGLENPTVYSVTAAGKVVTNGVLATAGALLTNSFAFTGMTLGVAGGWSFDMETNSTLTVIVAGTIAYTNIPATVLTNIATVRWTSMDGTVANRSAYNTSSGERTGTNMVPAAGVNASTNSTLLDNYAASTVLSTVTLGSPNLATVIAATSEAFSPDIRLLYAFTNNLGFSSLPALDPGGNPNTWTNAGSVIAQSYALKIAGTATAKGAGYLDFSANPLDLRNYASIGMTMRALSGNTATPLRLRLMDTDGTICRYDMAASPIAGVLTWTFLPSSTGLLAPGATDAAGLTPGLNLAAISRIDITGNAGALNARLEIAGIYALRALAVPGEIVRIRQIVELPEGTSPDFSIYETGMPAGFKYLNDGTARVAFLANGAGITSLPFGSGAAAVTNLPAGAALNLVGSDTNLLSISLAPGSGYGVAIGGLGIYSNNVSTAANSVNTNFTVSAKPYFRLGTLVNNDNDPDAEYVILEFNALIANDNDTTAANGSPIQAGVAYGPTFMTYINTSGTKVQIGATSAASDFVNVLVAEPQIDNLTVQTLVPPVDAGDPVTYRVTFSNTVDQSGGAYGPTVRVATTNAFAATFAATGGLSGTGRYSDAPTVMDGVALADNDRVLVKDQATTSQNGIYKVVDAAGGTWDRATDFAAAAQMNLGYRVRVLSGTLNAGRMYALDAPVATVNTSPMTFSLVAANPSVRVATTANLAGYVSPIITGVTNTIDGVTLALGDRVLVKSQTTSLQNGIYAVTNVSATVVLARATDYDGSGEAPLGLQVYVAAGAVNGGQTFAQQTVNTTIGTTTPETWAPVAAVPAFDLVLTNTLPPGVLFQSVTVTTPDLPSGGVFISNGSSNGVAVVVPAVGTTGTVTVTLASLYPVSTIAGAVKGVTVDISGNVTNAARARAELVDTAVLRYTSLPGTGTVNNATGSVTPGISGNDLGERDGSGYATATDNTPPIYMTNRNNYVVGGITIDTLGEPTFDKSFRDGTAGPSATGMGSTFSNLVAVGESVFYDLLVTLPEGVTTNLTLVDAWPAGLRLESATLITNAALSARLAADFNGSLLPAALSNAPALPVSGPTNVTFTFTNATAFADNNAANNAFVLRLRGTVLNSAGNVTGVAITNTAFMRFGHPATNGLVVADSNPANDPVVVIVEPVVTLALTGPTGPLDAGDPIVYTLVLSNSSAQVAYDVALTNPIPGLVLGAALAADTNFTVSGFYQATAVAATTNVLAGATFAPNGGAGLGGFTGAPTTLDGVTLTNSAQVLVKNQTDASQNGLYVVTDAGGGSWSRADSYNETTEMTVGYRVQVAGGLTQAGQVFVTTNAVAAVNTTPQSWLYYATYAAPAVTNFEVAAGSLHVQPSSTITLPPGAAITLRLTGSVTNAMHPGDSLADSVNIWWTSTPGANADERTGSGGINTYTTSNQTAATGATLVTADKTLFATDRAETSASAVTIGETAIYALRVVLPEGTITNLTVTDLVPAGMQYTGYALMPAAAGSGGLLSADFAGALLAPSITGGAGNGSPVTFTFSNIVNPGNNLANDNAFLLLVSNRVLDVAGNVGVTPPGSSVLTNRAIFAIPGSGGASITSTPVVVTVVEPKLGLTKDITQTLANAGDTVDVVLVATNTGTSAAYDVIVRDPLSPALFAGASATLGTSNIDYPADFSAAYDAVSNAVVYSNGTIAAGASARFVFHVPLATGVLPGQIVTNTALITQATTLSGVVVGERYEPGTQAVDTVTIRSSSVAGFVYGDTNNNGLKDNGEPAITNVTITLSGTNHLGGQVLQTTATIADGSYAFGGLRPGVYTLTETQPGGWLDGQETVGTLFGGAVNNAGDSQTIAGLVIPLDANSAAAGYNFGELLPASLAGRVYVDFNTNGVFNVGEPGISNVTVTLTGTDDRGATINSNASTDTNGQYVCTNLRPGTYALTETQPAGYGQGAEHLGSLGGTVGADTFTGIPVASGNVGTNYDFGEQMARLGDFVWEDLNGNGVQEAGEPGVSNVTVRLLNAASNLLATATTDSQGHYAFTNLLSSTYLLEFAAPTGMLFTRADQGTNDLVDSDADVQTGRTVPIALGAGVADTSWDAGLCRSTRIGDFVWVDANANGRQDGGETGLVNVAVTLYDTNNTVMAVTTSSVAGAYSFTNLLPGVYVLGFAPPSGWLFTTSNVGSDASDSDADPVTGRTAAYTLTSGQTDNTVDAGFYRLASLAGTVLLDVNGNGLQDAGETNGIAGATLRLYDAGSNVVATVGTVADGAYVFANLVPGAYTVVETDAAGYLSTGDIAAPNDNRIPATLVSGQSSTGNNFFDALPATLGDFVWHDLNGNGVQDAGEPGLSNVTVRLLSSATNVLQTAQTSTNGAYAFTNLAPATYLLQFTAPSGFVFTTVYAGTNAAVDSDAAPTNGMTVPFTLTSGQTDLTRDAGLYVPARLYGYGFTDKNGNLVRDTGDTGVTNMLVMLWTNGVELASMRTGTNGYYAFTGLAPETYEIRFLCHTNALEAVPQTNAPAATNPERNRTVGTTNDNGFILCTLVSGDGVITGGEPQNAGFISGLPTAAAVLIRAYATADGVVVEFETIDETGDNDMVLYLYQNGQWVEVGRQPSVGDGNNFYQFIVPGLAAGSVCDLMVLDDAGQQHTTYGLTVGNFAADLVLMTRQSLTLQWASIPNRTYTIYWTDHLGGDWTSIKSLKASLTKTFVTVAIDPAKPAGFFKIVMQP